MGGYTFKSNMAARIFSQLPPGMDTDPWAINEIEAGVSTREIDGLPLFSLTAGEDEIPYDNGTRVGKVTWQFGQAKLKELETGMQSQLSAFSDSLARYTASEGAARDLYSTVSQLRDVTASILADTGQTDPALAKELQTHSSEVLAKYWKYAQAGAAIIEAVSDGGGPGRDPRPADVLTRVAVAAGTLAPARTYASPGLSSSGTPSSSSGKRTDETGADPYKEPDPTGEPDPAKEPRAEGGRE
jgi:hypothetical protein